MNNSPQKEVKMTEQEQHIKIQMDIKSKTRILDILTILTFLLIMYGFSLATLISPDAEFSEAENRYLQQKPQLSSDFDGNLIERIKSGKFLDRLFNGKFTNEINDYYSDQFPARDLFVGAKAVSEIAILKQQNNNVVLGKDGYVIKRIDYPDMDIAEKNVAALNKFDAVMKELNIPFSVSMAGRSVDVLEKYLPSIYPRYHTEDLWNYFEKGISNISYINLLSHLKEKVNNNEYVYYKTDHHWTTLGAYYGYAEIMKSYDIEPQPLTAFTQEIVSNEFYGTTWSSAGMKWIKPDALTYFRYDGDDTDYVTEVVDTNTLFDGFYDRSYLDKKDKYSSFISGNNAHVKIYRKDGQEREKLLLIKDSFAHSMAPFLAYHFDLEILDLRYYKESVKKFIETNGVDRVLVMYNINSITEANTLGILNIGLK